jgi:hypothetical protein
MYIKLNMNMGMKNKLSAINLGLVKFALVGPGLFIARLLYFGLVPFFH